MLSHPKRFNGLGDLHFITFSCYQRLPLLGTPAARTLFVNTLATIRERYQFLLAGYVVMPEHIHLIISERSSVTPSLVLKVMKQRVARDLRSENAKTPYFWQPRFYDFNIYSPKKLREKLNYMHANPVERGLVRNPCNWPGSSFISHEKGEQGLIPIDFIH
jgi:putative transposase